MQHCSTIRTPCHLREAYLPKDPTKAVSNQTPPTTETSDSFRKIYVVLPETPEPKPAKGFQWKYLITAFVLGYIIAKK